jgi:hypothetical protein
VVLREEASGEPARHRRVLEGLHIDGVQGCSALEFDDDYPAVVTEPEHVEPVFLWPGSRRPMIELEGHDHHVWADDLRVLDHPLLEMLSLL